VGVYESPALRRRLAAGLPVIYAFWHRYQLLMAFVHRGRGVRVLVSRSRDGEFIARTLERLGFQTARGSSSRGGATAFRELLAALTQGRNVAVTPDGPRGPSESIQPGVLALAAATGAPVVPIAWAGGPVRRLRSWDGFLVPLPFGRYEVVYGDPVTLPADDAVARRVLAGALTSVREEAERRLIGRSPC
jgi:lysophospholipid acyltransferase (LPLAT)-like uncharacterized protein